MTPLITEIVKLAPDPGRYYWFDMAHPRGKPRRPEPRYRDGM